MAVVQASSDWTTRVSRAFETHYLALIVLALPALLLSLFAAGSGHLPGDLAITLFVQDHTPADLAWLFEAANAAGGTIGTVLITLSLALGLYAVRNLTFATLLLLTLPLRLLNSLLKLIAGSPRPPDELVRVSEAASGLGFPSGHVMGATLLYGVLLIFATRQITHRALRLGVQIGASAMLVLMGLSRIYVGAHWPSDVLGGYLFGAIGLIALITAGRHLLPFLDDNGMAVEGAR